jgi:hypothetical protein
MEVAMASIIPNRNIGEELQIREIDMTDAEEILGDFV